MYTVRLFKAEEDSEEFGNAPSQRAAAASQHSIALCGLQCHFMLREILAAAGSVPFSAAECEPCFLHTFLQRPDTH